MLSEDQKTASSEVVGGCYRVEAELGKGGMARVFRVVDERSGQRLALKQLVVSDRDNATVRAMFEHEYHTLVQLAHPRIVRVFDYGLAKGQPYYTMQLLEGADARETLRNAPLSVPQVCLLLRDAASALALIHSRRMVHRDVSPRNLWCTPDGHGTLIDFGTLVAMGPQTQIAGTPPFVAPEAVYMQPLDARCDIYGLGALAYFLLTGRNAYPAREMRDLRQLWQRRPKRPIAIKPELPAALSELVMAMLSVDARGRPGSAAEVFERLTAIGELPVEDERHFAQAFLTSPKLVGREEASGFLRKRLLRAIRGRGSAAAIVAPAGLGRSRMLASFVLEAKLMGAATIAVDAAAVGSGPFALAGALAERLLDVLPMTAAAATDLGPVLGHITPALHRAMDEPKLAELTPLERSRKLSSALVALFEAACRKQRLVIGVDDVHRADGASLGVLGRVSVLTGEHRLLLVTTCDEGALSHPPPALEQLAQSRSRIALAPLDAEDTHELLGSLFGMVSGLDEASSWLHELSQGSPQTCMQYAQYLVDHELARYEGGQWTLPLHLRDHGLPATLGAMLEGRLSALSEDARTLALGLALARDESRSAWQPENHIRIEDFPKLLHQGDAARTFAALDELLSAGMVQQRDRYYVLAQRAMVDALLRITDIEARRHLHRRLAEILAQPVYQGRMSSARQLQLAGDGARAREMLVQFAIHLSSGSMDWGAMRVSVTAEVGQKALEHWQAHGGLPRDGITLRRLLLMVCSVYDWSLARFGDAQIARLRADCGLLHFEQTDPTQPALQRVLECLKLAQQEHEQKPEAERGLAPLEAVRDLAGCTFGLGGSFVNSHDVAHARMLPGILEPLRPLSPLIALIADFCEIAVARVCGLDHKDRTLEAIERLLDSKGLPEVLRLGGAAVYLHAQALEDARRGRTRALQLMDRLAISAGEDMFLVLHGRWLGNAFRGQAAAAQKFRKQVEVATEDDVWRRKTFLFIEAQLHALTGDLLNLKRTSEAIAELTDKFEGWRPWLYWCRAQLHRLRGELDDAALELQAALELARPGEHRAWTVAAPAQAELLLQQGDVDGALRAAEAIVQAVSTLSLDPMAALSAERVRALAQSSRHEHEAARASLARAFALAHQLAYDGLPLALLYEAQARIALAAEDAQQCVTALTLLLGLLEHADAPALINAYEALREESSRQLAIPELPAVVAASRTIVTESSETYTQVRTRLGAANERQDRARQALELLLEESGARSGHLFLFDEGGLFTAASIDESDAQDELLSQAQQYLDAELGQTETAAVTVADLAAVATTAPALLIAGDSRLTPILLSDRADGMPTCTGLALLATHDVALRTPRHELLRAISRCLQAAGDTVPLAVDG